MKMIEVSKLTKDYGGKKGVFDLSFSLEEGEVLGFLGPNGAGKTTTIRHLMGFIRPDGGTVSLLGMDCFRDAKQIQRQVGYLPGEIAFDDRMTGTAFLKFMAEMKGMGDLGRGKALMERFQLDPSGRLARMSKGMKQKIAIVCAFMQDPALLILDEPTSGLDPLMQSTFLSLLQEERGRGKTILMSSHLFEETERICNKAAILRQGRLMEVRDMDSLKSSRKKGWVLTFSSPEDAQAFCRETDAFSPKAEDCRVTITLTGEATPLLRVLAPYQVLDITTHTPGLEELFMGYYGSMEMEKGGLRS